jgi:hypothetical protein
VRPIRGAIALAAAAVVVVIVLILVGGGSGQQPPATGAASIVPADALAYVNLSLGRDRPAVRQALAVVGRFPDYPLAAAAVLSRLGAILGGGRAIDVSTQIEPWLGDEAALALLNTPTSTAGTLIILSTSDQARARAFIRAEGATSHGVYRGTTLYVYPSGSELAFVDDFLVLGQDSSVRAAIDVAAGASASLASASVYQRAAATEPVDRVLDAYASVAGVRRLLAPQGGIVGALGGLLYQPALEGVTIALSPTAGGARVQVHSALDPQLARLSSPATTAFSPSLQNVMPTGSILMLDVSGLDRIAPQVLNAGATAGVAGDIGPLLSRLGTALTAEGVDVSSIVSIFHQEAAVAIVPHAQAPTLVIVARAPDQAKVRTELAQLEIPLAQLFKAPASASGNVPEFNDRQIGGVTAHQLVLTSGLQLDYAVFNGLVAISTSLPGLEAVAQQKQTLAHDPSFQFTLAHRPARVTSLVYLNFDQLLTLGEQTGLTSSATFETLHTDLEQIAAVGLSSTRSPGQSSAQISIRIR